jgi:hypothetical protein
MRVYFTIDTETTLGGAWNNGAHAPVTLDRTVFGQNGSGSYGVPLIMDILEEHGFTGTFFIEVFCSYLLGLDPVATVFDCIQKRGHDAQLHLHPAYRFYSEFLNGGPRRPIDLFFKLPLGEQCALVRDGVQLFRRLSGKSPRAFRAGCFGASEATLIALRENGVFIDSSYNLCYRDRSCGFQQSMLNAPCVLEGVREFPVTNFCGASPNSYKPLEISAVSVSEMLAALRLLRHAGCKDAVLVLHSFSFLKSRDIRFEKCRPDRIVIGRFRKLCRELSKRRSEFEVCTLGNVDVSELVAPQPHVIPSVGWFRPAARKVVQALDYIPWV